MDGGGRGRGRGEKTPAQRGCYIAKQPLISCASLHFRKKGGQPHENELN